MSLPTDSRCYAIINNAAKKYNAARIGTDGTITETDGLELINECLREDLALDDYFTQESLVDITAAEDAVDLKVAIPGIRKVLALELADDGIFETGDLKQVDHIQTWQQLQEVRRLCPEDYATLAYCLFGLTIYWLNTPSATEADAIKILNSYIPALVGTGSGETFVDTPEEIPNRMLVAWILKEMFLRDNRKAGAPELFKYWNGEYLRLRGMTLDAELPTDISVRPGRG